MKKIDLHTHSNCSDGTLTPEELIAHAAECGLAAIALTDHDSIGGVARAAAAAEKIGLEFVPGVELAADYHGREIHMLGLFINYTDSPLKEKLPHILQIRVDRNVEMIRRLNAAGAEITLEDLTKDAPDAAAITRAHFGKALVASGFCKDVQEAFTKYLGPTCPTYVPRDFLPAAEAIALIKASGGIPVLAHPTLYKYDMAGIEKMISELADAGLAGMECYYPTYSYYEHNQMMEFAKKYRLLAAGGSDFHGANKPTIELGVGHGDLFVPYEVLEELRDSVL